MSDKKTVRVGLCPICDSVMHSDSADIDRCRICCKTFTRMYTFIGYEGESGAYDTPYYPASEETT